VQPHHGRRRSGHPRSGDHSLLVEHRLRVYDDRQAVIDPHPRFATEPEPGAGDSSEDTGPPRYNDYTWTGSWETAAGGLANTYDVRFVGDVELTIELTTSDPSNTLGGDFELVALPLNWKAGETANHFTYLAFDRLMGWHVIASASG
jgi:hypothetical protein